MKSVFGQVCAKMSTFGPDSLMLPHRVWKVKFIGKHKCTTVTRSQQDLDEKRLQYRYAAQNDDVDLCGPQGVDLEWGGSSSQIGVIQKDGLSHGIKCKALLKIKQDSEQCCIKLIQFTDLITKNSLSKSLSQVSPLMTVVEDTANLQLRCVTSYRTDHYLYLY